jgi:hypothetical protein
MSFAPRTSGKRGLKLPPRNPPSLPYHNPSPHHTPEVQAPAHLVRHQRRVLSLQCSHSLRPHALVALELGCQRLHRALPQLQGALQLGQGGLAGPGLPLQPLLRLRAVLLQGSEEHQGGFGVVFISVGGVEGFFWSELACWGGMLGCGIAALPMCGVHCWVHLLY